MLMPSTFDGFMKLGYVWFDADFFNLWLRFYLGIDDYTKYFYRMVR